MAYIVNLYKNVAGEVSTPIIPGVAAFTGDLNDLSNWNNRGRPYIDMGENYDIYAAPTTAFLRNHASEITLSGGQYICDAAFPATVPDSSYYDTQAQNNSTKIYNPQFAGAVCFETTVAKYYLCIQIFADDRYIDRSIATNFRLYTQSPENVPFDGRTKWNYQPQLWNIISNCNYADANHRQTRLYKCTVGGRDFYALFSGVSGAGTIDMTATGAKGTTCILIPAIYFADAEPRPWVGETAEDDSETAFLPPDGGEWHDAITTRTNYDVNPYGVNQGGGLKVIFPTVGSGGTIYPLGLQYIINGIYRGQSEGVINSINQIIADATGGNANRPAEEVQAIISAIMSLHSVPVIYPTGTAGSYAAVATTFQTVSGYEVTWLSLSVTSPGQKTVFEWVYTTDIISRRLNCFLDFEPFTTLTLKLPFFPPVQLSPSAVFGHRLQIDYKIDILTGLLSADVSTTDDSGTYYIITTLQGNVKTAIPVMGQGAQNAVLEKITGAIVSTAKEGAAGALSGAISASDELAKSAHGVTIGNMSIDGLGAYLSPRAAYLICTHPVAAIPASYSAEGAIIGNFLDNVGMAANLGGKVGDFAGGFAVFSAVDLSGFECTDAEKAAIIALLRGGVYL